ncbi:hypothetical protein [Streptomyces odontomachi]|uniref:hypothetical protein n=1 Tax=Streptomyces odontomachi TaxID=2944940 RepID=UPI00210C8974|nr:hypothetical protein [Streptomyces sp. ODS25]
MTSAPNDFASAETFPCTVTIGAWARRFLFELLATIFPILLVLVLVFHVLGAGSLSWPLAIVPSAAFGIVMWVAKKRQFDETWGTARLELSSRGAVVLERHCRLELPWDQVYFLGKADLINKGAKPTMAGGRAGVIAGLLSMAVIATTRRRGQAALIGKGRLTVSPGASRLVRGQIARNQGARDVDPRTGGRLTAIVLPAYDRNWRSGRIGQWIQAHRADLLADPTRTP